MAGKTGKCAGRRKFARDLLRQGRNLMRSVKRFVERAPGEKIMSMIES